MSRKRYISTDVSKSGKLEELARQAGEYGVLLFTWMVPHLDDWGRMEGAADKVFFEVTPRFALLGRTPDDAETALEVMHDLGLIQRYEVKGKLYLQANVDTFYELQTYIAKAKRQEDKSHYPPPPIKEVAQSSTESHEGLSSVPPPSPSPTPTKDEEEEDAREPALREAAATSDDPPESEDPEWTSLFTQIFRGNINERVRDELDQAVEEFGLDLVKEAMRRALDNADGPPRTYLPGIFRGWREQGIFSMEGLRKEDERRKKRTKRGKSPPGHKPSAVDARLRELGAR